MRALDAWRHYLLGSPTTVQVFTDHKNLTYFQQPRNLNRQQARWLLDLSKFDLTFKHIPSQDLCAPNALSCHPDHIPASDTDNEAIILLPSSASNLLVLDALHALPGEVPAAFCSCLSDWCYNVGILTYQGHIYVLANGNLHHSVITRHHDHPTAGHP